MGITVPMAVFIGIPMTGIAMDVSIAVTTVPTTIRVSVRGVCHLRSKLIVSWGRGTVNKLLPLVPVGTHSGQAPKECS